MLTSAEYGKFIVHYSELKLDLRLAYDRKMEKGIFDITNWGTSYQRGHQSSVKSTVRSSLSPFITNKEISPESKGRSHPRRITSDPWVYMHLFLTQVQTFEGIVLALEGGRKRVTATVRTIQRLLRMMIYFTYAASGFYNRFKPLFISFKTGPNQEPLAFRSHRTITLHVCSNSRRASWARRPWHHSSLRPMADIEFRVSMFHVRLARNTFYWRDISCLPLCSSRRSCPCCGSLGDMARFTLQKLLRQLGRRMLHSHTADNCIPVWCALPISIFEGKDLAATSLRHPLYDALATQVESNGKKMTPSGSTHPIAQLSSEVSRRIPSSWETRAQNRALGLNKPLWIEFWFSCAFCFEVERVYYGEKKWMQPNKRFLRRLFHSSQHDFSKLNFYCKTPFF